MAFHLICLDTNYLIRCLVEKSEEERRMIQWTREGEMLITSSVAWYEFRCGPVSTAEIDTVQLFLKAIVPFTELEAEVAGKLFEKAGRKRHLKTDAMIAATALVSRSKLATNNKTDFRNFPGIDLV